MKKRKFLILLSMILIIISYFIIAKSEENGKGISKFVKTNIISSKNNYEYNVDEKNVVYSSIKTEDIETTVGTEFSEFSYGYNKSGGITIFKYRLSGMEARNHVVIPESYNDYIINAIDNKAFWNNDILSIEMSDKVEYIGDECFYSCRSLSGVYLSKGLTYLGKSAFANCFSIKSVEIPASLTELDEYAFFQCPALKNLVFNDGLKTIGYRAFRSCTGLPTTKLPKTLEIISEEAFARCQSLKEIKLPRSVKTLGEKAFCDCTALEKIVMFDNIHEIPISIFTNSPKVKIYCEKYSDAYEFAILNNVSYVVLEDVTLTYDSNTKAEVINIPDNQTLLQEDDGYVSTKIPERENHEFLGWTTNKESKEVEYAPGDEICIVENTTLYAVWNGEEEKIKDVYDMSNITFEDASFDYDGEAKIIEITGELPEVVTVEYEIKAKEGSSLIDGEAIEVGEYIVTAKFTGDAENYELIEDMQATLVINEEKFFENLTRIIGEDGEIYLEEFELGTTVEQISEEIKHRRIEVLDKDGEVLEGLEKLATGMQIKINAHEGIITYKVVILGDINGDGEMSDIDLLLLARFMIGCERELELVKNEYLRASNMYYDEELADDRDLLKLARELIK